MKNHVSIRRLAATLAAAFLLVSYARGVGPDAPAKDTAKPQPMADRPTADKSTEKSPDKPAAKPAADAATPSKSVVPDPRQTGGEPDGVVQVANLVYAVTKSSRCFSDHFLVAAEKESSISTSRRFHAVKLSSDNVFDFPLVIMTGEGDFELTDEERQNLRRYVERGGLLLASAGCSSPEWDRAFRREMATVFAKRTLEKIPMSHPIFHTVTDIPDLSTIHGGGYQPLEGISIGGRLGVIYSQDGLNDAHSTPGCCCCGGNEIENAVQINVNILAYALTY
jgi:hypothetical protein